MNVYIYIYIYTHVHIYYMYIYIHTSIYIRTHISICTWFFDSWRISVTRAVDTATYCNTLQLTCNTLPYMYIHTRIETYTYIYMYTWFFDSSRISVKRAVDTATHCNTLQHTATHCNTLQHTTTHCNTLQPTAAHCNTLQHTATHCNTLQHAATRIAGSWDSSRMSAKRAVDIGEKSSRQWTLQHSATKCSSLQYTTHTNTPTNCHSQHPATHLVLGLLENVSKESSRQVTFAEGWDHAHNTLALHLGPLSNLCVRLCIRECAAVCCSVLHSCCGVSEGGEHTIRLPFISGRFPTYVLHCVALCCTVLHCVALC